jgi:hypothetical protein
MEFRAIERHHGVDRTTVICRVKQGGQPLPQALPLATAPAVAQLDEYADFCGVKKTTFDSGQPLRPERVFGLGR